MQILVVDDTKNIRTLLTKCLETEGYTVKAVSDGQAALKLLQTEPFGLVFLDIKMPFFSGTEVLKKMRETGINMPVIIITAYATVKNAIDCTNLGAVAYLQKPFTPEKIRTVLNEIIHFCPEKDGLENILALAKSKLEGKLYHEAEHILKNALPDYPLEPELYRLLAQTKMRIKDATATKK